MIKLISHYQHNVCVDHHHYCNGQDIDHYDHVHDHYNDDTDDANTRL